jgi:hypothetical protein
MDLDILSWSVYLIVDTCHDMILVNNNNFLKLTLQWNKLQWNKFCDTVPEFTSIHYWMKYQETKMFTIPISI